MKPSGLPWKVAKKRYTQAYDEIVKVVIGGKVIERAELAAKG